MFCFVDYTLFMILVKYILITGDASSRSRPQENRWLTKFIKSNKMSIKKIVAGGYHNLVLMKVEW